MHLLLITLCSKSLTGLLSPLEYLKNIINYSYYLKIYKNVFKCKLKKDTICEKSFFFIF